MLKESSKKYMIDNFYNLNKKGPESKLEVIVNGVKVAIKSTLKYIKKYVSATPETGDEGSKYHKESNKKW